MKLEASPGHVVMIPFVAPTVSKIVMPDNVQMAECPTFELVAVGEGRTSQYGIKETIPYKRGDRVIVAAGRCMPIKDGDQTLYIVDWTLIFAKIKED